jgi:hypothetical protein
MPLDRVPGSASLIAKSWCQAKSFRELDEALNGALVRRACARLRARRTPLHAFLLRDVMYPQSGFLRCSALHSDHEQSPHPLPRLGALLQIQQELFRAQRRGEKAQSGTCDRVRPLLLALLRLHSVAHQPLLFASTPTPLPPRRCLLDLLPLNSMSARPPPAPGSSTCQVLWPRIVPR